MHRHSLSFERIAQSFELFAVLDRVPTSVKNQIEASGHANRRQPPKKQLNLNSKTCPPCPNRHNTPQKSTHQNGAEAIFLNGVGGLPLQPKNKGLKAVLKGFDSPISQISPFLAFPKGGHLPSSLSNPAAMHLLRSHREKSPHPASIENDGLFWPANRKRRPRLCPQPSTWSLGFSALPHPSRSICRSRLQSPDHSFGAARQTHFFASAGRLVCLSASPLLHPLPHPGVRAGVFVAAA